MRHTILGKSGLDVSRIAFGTWQLGGDWGPTDDAAAIEAIRRAADRGVTFFDTAQGYGFGQSEQLLADGTCAAVPRERGRASPPRAGCDPTGAGVVRDASPAWIRQGVEASLRALDTDYIDLYQVHWPDPATPFEETAEELAKLVADGKIRHVGVSNFDVEQMEAFSATLPVETLQPPYHLFRREIEAEVLPYTAANDIGVLVYGPLAHGLLERAASAPTPRSHQVTGDRRARVPRRGLRAQPASGRSHCASWPPRSWASRWPSWRSPGRWPTRPCTSPSSVPATRPRRRGPGRGRRSTSTTRCCGGSTRSWPTPFRSAGPSPEGM